MIPAISTIPYPGPWMYRMRNRSAPLIDYEHAGVALNDPSQGLRGYDWTARYDPADSWVYLWREDQGEGSKVPVLQRAGISRIGLAFDQNMRPHLCWVEPAGTFLWRYSAADGGMATMQIPGATDPCLTLDDRRPERVSESDIILSYMQGSAVCFRVQRELFGAEYSADIGRNAELTGAGMAGMRFQWGWR